MKNFHRRENSRTAQESLHNPLLRLIKSFMYLDIFSTFAEKNERLPSQYSSEKGTVWQPLIEGIFSCYAIKLQAGCVRLIQWRNFKPTLHYYIFVWKCMLFGAFSLGIQTQDARKRWWKQRLSETVSKVDFFEKRIVLVWKGENGGFWKRWRKN